MTILVYAVDDAERHPFEMPGGFRHDIVFFATPAGEEGAPDELPEGEYWVRLEDSKRIYDDGVLRIVSPLDSAVTAEIELSEEQEDWLEWMIEHGIQRVRLE